MKILRLNQAHIGVPFYTLKTGDFFQFLVYDDNGVLRPRSEVLYESDKVLMKSDIIGAIDYPYDKSAEENTLYVHEKEIVQVIKRTHKVFKTYVKEKRRE